MQRKIKAVLRSARRKSHSPRHSYDSSEASSPRTDRFSTDGRGRASLEASSPRSRPVSSAQNGHLSNGTPLPPLQNTPMRSFAPATDSANMSIADDYKAYLPALRPLDNAHRKQDMSLERNVDRRGSSLDQGRNKPLPEAPSFVEIAEGRPRKQSLDVRSSNETSQRSVPDWKAQQAALREGVVDLRNTVDVDKDTMLAAPVVHEVIKPHEHEIIQHEIHREIHNYTYYHRLQPVIHTEVLPPRHFIPNPHGEGLVEITADELPSRTGQNRKWEIMQKHTPQTCEIQSAWRTEPEVIHGKPYMTKEGFERKETTILYPPTLADMTRYEGAVQPVHFDHKTGERWLGEMTTMSKLEQQHDHDKLTRAGLSESLPHVAEGPSVKRKPVGVAI